MTQPDIREDICSALNGIHDDDFEVAAKRLFEVLGYQSERTEELPGSVDDFIREFPAPNQNTKSEEEFRKLTESVKLIFQVTSDEVGASTHPTIGFDSATFDKGQQQSFVFFSVELKESTCTRGEYARFTREINKRLSQPSVVLFRTTSNLLTLAFVHRREHKRDPARDVLGKVSLIREIAPKNPHRAHLDILAELSLTECTTWMDLHNKPNNFDGLLAAWLDKLDTEELNRRFYGELFDWFERAVSDAKFPANEAKTLEPEEHTIRLITRLMFVWFIKEKKLIAEGLFIEQKVSELLEDFDLQTGDSYYRAILQNLFFATLNTEIDKRRFSRQNRADHRNPSVYRYRKEMTDPDGLLELFAQTPFINGGLFDCLDDFEAVGAGGARLDCFTDNPAQRREYSIPNHLFFGGEGLITLFNNYKFTVEENTPIEQEVALDPELLGKVFENLLAAYNPETQDTARRRTGSYYTPRAVVDYMVDEVVLATLKKDVLPADGNGEFWEERLRYLLDYEDAFDDANELFEEVEAEAIVHAIAKMKVLDPAVGSGAFPMGMLHKLTLALRRLDPRNLRWKALQRERARAEADAAFENINQHERDAQLLEISDTFQRYSGDFGRKLYLIQNSIFGVDIQPVACQIAKLRFFISLAIEQDPDEKKKNLGIKPLPNLETRFVAADTLVGLKLYEVHSLLQDNKVQQFRMQIEAIRARYFLANNRPKKLQYIRQEKDLLDQLERELEALRANWVGREQREIERRIAQIPNAEHREQLRIEEQKKFKIRKGEFDLSFEDARKIARWKSYDQNAKADWFDTKYMFGIEDGFNVVIGNPPYIQLQKNGGELGKRYKKTGFETFVRTGDVYQLFYEKGCQLLKPTQGLLAYITSNSWLKAEYGKALRRYFSERHTPLRLLEMGKDVFVNTIVDTSVLILREGNGNNVCRAVDIDKLPTGDFPPPEGFWGQTRLSGEKPWSILSRTEQSVMDKMQARGTPLKDWDIAIYRGVLTGYNDAFVIDNDTKEALITEDSRSAEIIKPLLRGRDIQRYSVLWAGLWLIDTHNGYGNVPAVDIEEYPAIKNHLDEFFPQLEERQDKGSTPYNLRNCAYHEEFSKQKLFWMDMSNSGRFAYSKVQIYCNDKGFFLTGESLKYLCAILNSTLITWLMKNNALTTGMGLLQWKKFAVEHLPIPRISVPKQNTFVCLVDRILEAKRGRSKCRRSRH